MSRHNRRKAKGLILSGLLILSVFASIPVGGAATTQTAESITATDFTLLNDSGYTNEPLTAAVTVNNTQASKDTKQVTVEAHQFGGWVTVGSRSVTVEGNSKRTVNVTYALENPPAGDNATIRVNELSNSTIPIQFTPATITNTTTSTETLTAGESLTENVTVDNYADEPVDRLVTLTWGNQSPTSELTKTVTVGPRSTTNISFKPTLHISGVHALHADDEYSAPITVTDPNVDITATGGTVQTKTIFTDEKLSSNTTLSNSGSDQTEYAVTLVANNARGPTEFKTKTVSILGNESKNVSIGTHTRTPGEYSVSLNTKTIGTATARYPYNVTNVSSESPPAIVGQGTNITFDVTNRKETSDDPRIEIQQTQYGEWRHFDDVEISLNGSEKKEVTINPAFTEIGSRKLKVGNSEAITVDVLPAVNVTEVKPPSEPVNTDDPTTVNATVTNRLDSAVTTNVTLSENRGERWSQVTAKEVDLNAGETKQISVPVVFDIDGPKTLRLGDARFTLNVTNTPVYVPGVTVSERHLTAGNQTKVTATLRNSGETTTEFKSVLNINGDEYDSNSRQIAKTVDVPADGSTTVSYTPTFETGGVHSIEVHHTDGGTVNVNHPNVSVVNSDVATDTVYKRDSTPVDVTVNNTAQTQQQFAVTVRADKNTSEWGTAANTTIITVPGNAEVIEEVTVRPSETGNYTVTANGNIAGGFRVKPGVKVNAVNFSADVVEVGESVYFNQTLQNPTSSNRWYFADVAGQSFETRIAAGDTKEVSREIQFSTPGPKRVWADGNTYTVYVVEDTTGTAELSLGQVYTPREVVNGSTNSVYAMLQNTGDTAAVRNTTLAINGTTVAKDRIFVPAGGQRPVYLEHTFTDTGDFTGNLSIDGVSDTTFNGSVRSEVVVDGSESISYVSGAKPDPLPVIDAQYAGGSIFLRATQNGNYVRDLSALGADNTTEFNVSFLVKDYNPRVVIGSGRDTDLQLTETDEPNTTRVTIHAKPSQLDYKHDFASERPTSPAEWDRAVQNNTADFGWDTALQLRVGNAKTAVPNVDSSAVSGMTVSTDAQLFTMPRYVPGTDNQPPHLEVSLAAPHETVDGNVNTGYYEAYLPDTLLAAWNVSNPSEELSASFQNQDLNMTVTETSNGAFVDISLHYSSGTLTIQKTQSTNTDNTDTGSSTDSSDDTSNSEGSSSGSVGQVEDGSDTQQTTTTVTPTTTTTSEPSTTKPTTETTVEPTATTTETATGTAERPSTTAQSSNTNTPGFGILGAVIALLAAVLISRKAT